MSDTTSNYLADLGTLIREEAFKAKASASGATGTTNHQFELGRLTAYYEVLSLMKQQGSAFGIPLTALSLEGVDPDSLMSAF